MAVAGAEAAERRRHYVIENGPRDWADDVSIARWIVALCLHSGERADALTRADEIVPRPPGVQPGDGLSPAEQLALAAAMYAAWSSGLQWRVPRIALAFGLRAEDAMAIVSTLASDIAVNPALRSGVNSVCLAVREAMVERVRAAIIVTDETPAEFKAWGPDAA